MLINLWLNGITGIFSDDDILVYFDISIYWHPGILKSISLWGTTNKFFYMFLFIIFATWQLVSFILNQHPILLFLCQTK